MINRINSECFDESQFPANNYIPLKKVSDNPETFREVNKKQSGKTNLATILIAGTVLASLAISGLLMKNYISKKIIPEIYQAVYGQFRK